MGKSLGDYVLEQSSLSGTDNIKWTQKNPVDTEKSKKEKVVRKTSPTNIIYTEDIKVKSHIEKVFKIEEDSNTESKKEKTGKKFRTSSTSNFKIIPGFSRKGRWAQTKKSKNFTCDELRATISKNRLDKYKNALNIIYAELSKTPKNN